MKNINYSFKLLFTLLITLSLFACGGSSSSDKDDDSGDTTPETTTISGTAAVGAALANKTVTVVDNNGKEFTTITDASGKYSISVSTSSPYMLKVETPDGVLFSFSEEGGTVNITPMTNLALYEANKSGDVYSPLANLFAAFATQSSNITDEKLNTAKAQVSANIASITGSSFDFSAFDYFSQAFDADGSGIDGVLDGITIAISGNSTSGIEINGAIFSITIDASEFIDTDNGGGDSGGDLSGKWTLTLTGTAGGFPIPVTILENLPADAVPSGASGNSIESDFRDAYGAAGSISNYKFTLVSSSATKVVAKVTALINVDPVNGFSLPAISYDVTYTYEKQ